MNALLVGQLVLILLWMVAVVYWWLYRGDPVGMFVGYSASVVLIACSAIVLVLDA